MAGTEPGRNVEQAAGNWETRSHMRTLVHIVATTGGLFVCYLIAQPFFPAFTWALTLAVLFYPVHNRIEKRWKQPGIAALISVLLASAIVAMPMIFLAERVLAEANKGVIIIGKMVESDEWLRAIQSNPGFASIARLIEDHLDIRGMIGSAAAWLTNLGASFVRISVFRMMLFLITFYMLFYFLRDRKQFLRSLCRLSPFSLRETSLLFIRVADTVHATFYGTVVVAAVQGALGGLMFWWLDLPAPILWGVVMGMLAIIPVLGAFVIWVPVALFLALEGNWVDAIVLTVWGTVVVGGIDNLIYPILVGNRLKLHTLPAFISIVGGLFVFGASGIILGPLALTITMFLLERWRSRISGTHST